MQRSEQINELATALAKAQGQMKAAPKDAANPFFNSHYADLASVINAIRGPFSANGLSYMQFPRVKDSAIEIETLLLHSSGQWFSEVLVLPWLKKDPQGAGTIITYGKRYGLQAMVGVPSEDDDGNAGSNGEKPKRPQVEFATLEQVETLTRTLPPGKTEEAAAKYASGGRVTEFGQLTTQQAQTLVVMFAKAAEKAAANSATTAPINVKQKETLDALASRLVESFGWTVDGVKEEILSVGTTGEVPSVNELTEAGAHAAIERLTARIADHEAARTREAEEGGRGDADES